MTIRGPMETDTPVADALSADPLSTTPATQTLEEEAAKVVARQEGGQQFAGLGNRLLRRLIPRKLKSGVDIRKGVMDRMARQGELGDEAADTLGKMAEESIKPPTDGLKPEVPVPTPEQSEGLMLRSVDKIGEEMPARPGLYGEGRNINFNYVIDEAGGNWTAMIDAVSEDMPSRGVRTHAQVKAEVDEDPMAVIKTFLRPGAKPVPLSDTQSYAARSLLLNMTEQVVQMRDKVLSGQATDLDKIEFRKMHHALNSYTAWLQGSVAETGRALNAMKMNANVLKHPDVKNITEAVSEHGMDPLALAKLMKLNEDRAGGPIEGMAKLSRLQMRVGVESVAQLFIASILSGPKTHVVNGMSNSLIQFYESLVVKPTAGAIGTVRRAVTGSGEGVRLGETPYEAIGLLASLWDATRMAGNVMKTGWQEWDWSPGSVEGMVGNTKLTEADPIRGRVTLGEAGEMAVRGTVGRVAGERATDVVAKGVRTPLDLYQKSVEALSFGVMSSMDAFNKELAYHGSIYGQAYRLAKEEGLSSQALTDRATQLINEPTPDMHRIAEETADFHTLQQRPYGEGVWGKATEALSMFVRQNPEMKFILPFIRTPSNILVYATQNSMIAPIAQPWRDALMAGGAQRDVALARFGLGVGQFFLITQLYETGVLTGSGPENYEQRKTLERTGWKPNSIYIDGTYYPMDRMDPFGMMVHGITEQYDKARYARDEPTAAGMIGDLIFSMANLALDSTYMKGMSDMLDAIQQTGTKAKAARLGSSIAASTLIPSFVSQIGQATDEKVRRRHVDPNNMGQVLIQAMKARWPGEDGRESLPTGRHWDGTPAVGPNNGAVRLLSPTQPSQNLPVNYSSMTGEQKEKIYDTATLELQRNGIKSTEPTKVLSLGEGLIRVPLLSLDGGRGMVYDKWVQIVGKYRRIYVEEAIKSPAYKRLDHTAGQGGEQAAYLQTQFAKGTGNAAKAEFLSWLKDEAEANPEKYLEMAQYLNTEDLPKLIRGYLNGSFNVPNLKGLRVRGLPPRGELPTPPHMQDVPRF